MVKKRRSKRSTSPTRKKRTTKKTTKKVSKKGVRKRKPFKKKHKKAKKMSAIRGMIHSIAGEGKTTLCANFPNTKFICDDKEAGVKMLAERGLIPDVDVVIVEDWPGLLAEIEETDGCQNLILETLAGFQRLGFDFHCHDQFDGDFSATGYLNYQNGPRLFAQDVWPDLLGECEMVVDRGINVFFTAHSKTKTHTNAVGKDYLKNIIFGHENVVLATYNWADAVGFLSKDVAVDKHRKAKSFTRYLYFDSQPWYEAKERLGIEPCYDCSGEPDEVAAEIYAALTGTAT